VSVCVCVCARACVCVRVCVQDLAFLDLFLAALVGQLFLKPCVQLWYEAARYAQRAGAQEEGSDEGVRSSCAQFVRAVTRRGAKMVSRTLV